MKQLQIKHNVKIELIGADGRVKETRISNTVTTAGKNAIADQLLASPSLAKPQYMAIGTGTPSGTALGAEVARAAFSTLTRSTNVVTAVGNYAAGTGTGTITEEGIFDAASVGNMHFSSSFGAITKGASDTLQITHTITVG